MRKSTNISIELHVMIFYTRSYCEEMHELLFLLIWISWTMTAEESDQCPGVGPECSTGRYKNAKLVVMAIVAAIGSGEIITVM